MRPLSLPRLIPFILFLWLVPACGDSADGAADTTLAAPAPEATTGTTSTTTTTTTTTPPTTTRPPTTTTAAPTTTTAVCPDFPSIGMSQSGAGEDLQPGSYNVTWALPNLTFAVEETTTVWLGERFDLFGWRPVPTPTWQHPRTSYEAMEMTSYDFLLSYDGESEIDIPDDPGEWLAQHPLLDAGEPVTAVVDGLLGVQVDAIVVGSHPGTGDSLRFGGSNHVPGQRWLPLGAAVRIIFVEVGDEPIWLILTATEDGFDEAIPWAESVIAAIEFC